MRARNVPILLRRPSVAWEIDATAAQIRDAIAAGTYLLPGSAGAALSCTRATTALQQGADGTWSSVSANVPAIDWLSGIGAYGLRIEEARTNSIRNSTMQGASAGSPGTRPTNWASGWTATASGLTFSIDQIGTEGGLPCVDVKIAGTSTNTTAISNLFDTGTQLVPALASQTWTTSVFWRVVDGSLGTLSVLHALRIYDTNGAALATSSGGNSPPTATFARSTHTFTISNGSAAYAMSGLRFAGDGSSTYNATIRIACPQLERGAFVTSPILTQDAAVTRAADQLSVANTAAGFIGQSAGTLLADVQFLSATHTSVRNILSLDDGTADNRIALRSDANTNAGDGGELLVVSGGVTQADVTHSTDFTTALVRVAAAYATDNFALYRAGASVGTPDTSGTVPATTTLRIGQDYAGASQANGYVTRIRVSRQRVANATLSTLTV